jgi:hypothetical protein
VFDGGLDFLGHEFLDSLHEKDGDEGENDEGDDGGPGKSVGGGVGVVACVKGCPEDAGVDACNRRKGSWATRGHGLHEICDGRCWEAGLDGCGSDLGTESLAQLVVDDDIDDCRSESTTDGTSGECQASGVGEVCVWCSVLNEDDEESQWSCLTDTSWIQVNFPS